MPCSRKFFVLAGCAALAWFGATSVWAEKSEKEKPSKAEKSDKSDVKKGKKKDADKSQSVEDKDKTRRAEKQPPKISLPLPEGQDSKGIIIPYTDGTGKKTMLFNIGVGRRIDENHVKMSDLMIETFNESGESEMTISLPSSILDLNSRVITGDESVTIKRSDFEITGKAMEFNTETKQGRIKGNVKMIIYDLSEETGEDTSASKSLPKKETGS